MMQSLQPGDNVGFYEIVSLLEEGRGGMSAVYRAKRRPHYQQEGYPEQVALKVALPGYGDHLRIEANFMHRFNHPNVVKAYGVREADNAAKVGEAHLKDGHRVVYMAMELLTGSSLTKRLEHRGRLSPREASLVARDLALALQHIHSRMVISLDIKPDNVLFRGVGRRVLGSYPRAVLCDFGIARDIGSPTIGEHAGTPGHIAPEQILYGQVDPRRLTPASDIFQWGILFYQMLTGDLPFGLDAGTLIDPNCTAQPISAFRRVSKELDLMVQRALQKDPARRYRNTDELLLDMQKLRLSTTRDL
jgi:serine/threonine protein kinase